jgi:Tfp pilus assembly protein PilF
VAVCPNEAIGFGYRKPSLFKSWSRSVRRHYDFSWGEEVILAVTWLATLFVFRGLYARVPFLVTLGLGGIMGYVAVLTIRLFRRESVAFNKFRLKRSGRLTTAGAYFMAGSLVVFVFVGHSAFVRYHEFRGHAAYDTITTAGPAETSPGDPGLLAGATAHLETVERWGLFNPPELDQRLATLHLLNNSPGEADPYLRRIVERDPGAAHELQADVWATQGDHAKATGAYERALAEDPSRLKSHLSLAELLANSGNYTEAVEHLEAAVAIKNDSAKTRYNLAVLLGQLGREDDAIEHYQVAARLTPRDVEIQNNLGFMLASKGEFEAAEERFRKAIELDPNFAHSHFNLGRLLLMQGNDAEAERQFNLAVELDPAYAELLR